MGNTRVVDTVTTTFGIRSLVWNGEVGFLLNDEPVEILKAAGFNSIRTAHNPPAPELLDACDRLGMLVATARRARSTARRSPPAR